MSDYHRFNSLKILAHSDRLRKIADGEYPFPLDWHIYPSNQCNHQCEWCIFIQNGEQALGGLLSLELMERAIDDAARTKAVLINFQGGGEPLVNKHTSSAMALVNEAGIKCALSTNGRLMTPEIASRVDYLRVSLNAASEAQHFKTNHAGRGVPDWRDIMAALEKSIPHKRGDVGLSFAMDHNNYHEVYHFCQMAAEMDVDFVHIRPVFYYDVDLDRQVREIMPKALELCQQAERDFGDKVRVFAITEKFDGYWSPRSYQRCKAVLTGIVLTATGEFSVCLDRTDLRFGHEYKNGETFETIWAGEEHRKLVESIASPGVLDACPRCVWNKRNEIIRYVFEEDSMRLDLI